MKHWNPVPWLREMQAATDPKKDVRYGMAADEIERLRAELQKMKDKEAALFAMIRDPESA
jgi:hypothetical protein